MASRTQPKVASQKDKTAFRSTLNRALADLGAQKLGPDEWLLETAGGPMRFVIFDDWAGARFEDIEKAQAKLPKSIRSEMNRTTGQWNMHFGPAANAASANDLAALVSSFLPRAAKSAPRASKVPAKRNPAGRGTTKYTAHFNGQTFTRRSENSYVACVIVVRTQAAYDDLLKHWKFVVADLERELAELRASEKTEAEWKALAAMQEKAYYAKKEDFAAADRARREEAKAHGTWAESDPVARRAEEALDAAYYSDNRARKVLGTLQRIRVAQKNMASITPVGTTWCQSWHQSRDAAYKVARGTTYRHKRDEVHVVAAETGDKPGAAKSLPPRRNPSTGDGDTFSQIEEHVQDFLQNLDEKIAEHRRLAGNQEMHLRTMPQDLDAREIKSNHEESVRTLGRLRADVVDAMDEYEFDRLVELGAVPADLIERHMDKVAEGMRNPARAGKPCGCKSVRSDGTSSERSYRDLEVQAQRSAATGDRAHAAQYREQAKKVLQQAHSAGETWAMPPKRNPALQTPLEECCGGAKRNPAFDAEFTDFDWEVIARLLDGALVSSKQREVIVRLTDGRQILISDNGGELNLSSVDPEGSRVYPYGTPHRLRDEGMENRPMYTPLLDYSIPYTSTKMRVGNVTLAYRLQTALADQQIDYDLDLDRDMPDSNAIPPKVRELEAKVLAENPGYSVGQARATAWSIFCKHVDPTSQHCKKLRHQYFAIKGGKGSEGFGKIRVVSIDLTPGRDMPEISAVSLQAREGADVWKQADSVLTDWARKVIAPNQIAEREVSFEIQWSEGRKYRGTYELAQDDRRGADLSHHISEALQVFAGKHKPAGMSPKDYERIVRQYGDEALGFIAKYDLGPSADDIDEVVKDMPKIATKKTSGPVAVVLSGRHPAAANSTKRSAKKPSKKGRVVASSKRAALSIDSPAFQAYLGKLRKQHSTRVLEAEDLKKYIRVSWKISPTSSSRSILLFVDKDTGNVHQAESWKRPKAVLMGNIFEGQ